MKRILVSNLLAALGVLALFLLVDIIHIFVHTMSGRWWLWAFLALAIVFFCIANRRLFPRRRPVVRFAAIGMLSALLAVVSFCGSFIAMLVFHTTVLSIPANVSGRVTDLAGRPIPGAHLELVELYSESSRRLEAETTSDTDGRFRLRTRHGDNQLSVHVEGYASMYFVRKAHVGWNRRWDFELAPAVTLSGRVIDTAGQPIPDRVVALTPLFSRRPKSSPATFRWGFSPEPTDRDGRYTITTAAPCLQAIRVKSRDNDFMQYPVNQRRVDLTSGQGPESLKLVLHPADAHQLAGHVRDTAGQPISNVYVDTYIPSGPHWTDRTDDQGAFCIQGLDGVGTSSFKVHFRGRVRGTGFNLTLDDVPMNTTNVNLVVPERAAICSTVLDAKTGKPVESFDARVVHIHCLESDAIWEKPGIKGIHGPDGHLCFSNLHAGAVTIEISAEGLGVQRFEIPVGAGMNPPVTFDLKEPAVLEIEVTRKGLPTQAPIGIQDRLMLPWVGNDYARSDAIPAGKHQVWLSDPQHAFFQKVVEVELRPGETTRLAVELVGSCEVSGFVNYPDEYSYSS